MNKLSFATIIILSLALFTGCTVEQVDNSNLDYQNIVEPTYESNTKQPSVEQKAQNVLPARINSNDFTCNCSKTCTKMSSCEEAYFQLINCGCGVRDGDNDGVPCENICR